MNSTDTHASGHAVVEECALCGALGATRSIQPQQFAYRDRSHEALLVANVPVLSCAACGETYTAEGAEEAQHNAVCRHLGRLTPDDIRELRERIGVSQAQLAERTGIGVASIKRWETGTVIQNASLDAQLRSLDREAGRTSQARPTPTFRTQLRAEALAAAQTFKLRRQLSVYAEAV